MLQRQIKLFLGALLLVWGLISPLPAVSSPQDPQAEYDRCFKELQLCFKAHNTTTKTYAANLDICWREARQCPQICVDEYAARRSAGVSALDADPLHKGRSYEQSSCVPGMDEIKFPGRRLLPTDSRLYLTLEGPDKAKKAEAIVGVQPLDDNDHVAVTLANPARQAHYETDPLLLPLAAGRYFIFASPRGDYAGFRDLSFTFTLKKGESLRKTLKFRPTNAPAEQAVGILHILGPSRENPVRYVFASGIDSNGVSNTKSLPKSEVISTSRDFSLPSGSYTLKLKPQNYNGGEQNKVISLGPGEDQTVKIPFQKPGELSVGVKGLAADQKVSLSIWSPENRQVVYSGELQLPPLVVKLAPGAYEASLYFPYADQTYGPQRRQLLDPFVIASDHTLDVQASFAPGHWGTLDLNALFMEHPVTAHVEITPADQPNFTIYPRGTNSYREQRMPLKITLLVGDYLLNIHGRASKSDIFPYPTFEQKKLLLRIKEGETLTKTLEFKAPTPSKLTLTVLRNGLPVKARIKGRRAGTKDSFNLVGATYNLLNNGIKIMPGTYDLWVQPLEVNFQPGIDVFHGRSGQTFVPVPAKGVEPIILHNVEILPESSTSKTVRFEGSE